MKKQLKTKKRNKVKLFKDLKFEPHTNGGGVMSKLELDNGYVVSVLANDGESNHHRGFTPYGNVEEDSYEIAIFDRDGEFLPLSPFDDVLGFQSVSEIDALMKNAQTDKDFESECRKNREPIEDTPLTNEVDDDVPF